MTQAPIPAGGAVEAKRDHRRPETYPALPDFEMEPVTPAADGRPWRKACSGCLPRTDDPQGVGEGYQHMVRYSNPEHHGLFYCTHRTDNGEPRVCACFAACRAGETARALPLTSKEDRT